MRKITFLFVLLFLCGSVFCTDLDFSMLKLDFGIHGLEKRNQAFELINSGKGPVDLSGYCIKIDGIPVFKIKGDIMLQPGAKQLFYFHENDKNQIKLSICNQTSPIRIADPKLEPQYSREQLSSSIEKKLKSLLNNFPDQIKKEVIQADKESLLKNEWRVLLSKVSLHKNDDAEIVSIWLTSLPLLKMDTPFAFWDLRMRSDFIDRCDN